MNRLQKKCFIAAAGMHLLLFVILLVGPAFLFSHSKTDDTQVINFIPANLIDGNFSGGGGPKSPTPPPAAQQQPVAQQQVSVPAPPPTPQKVADPVKPAPAPTPKELTKVDPKSKPDPDALQTKPVKTKPQISTQLVTRSKTDSTAAADAHAKQVADAAAAKQRANAIAKSIRSLRDGLSSTTTIDIPQGLGGSGEAYASYAAVVKSIYDNAWIEPADTSAADATGKATITIANDGTVISATLTTPSGDAKTDASIQRTLDSVKYIAPFPTGTTDKQRTYIINFNLKAKRLSA